ncbi:MAG: extracellular solute-binding protein [Candidatus Omnitrophica bacterium]|nr:extracellular solute-binding protein [Candidatus Omnitrophota bacterium]
MKRLLARFCIIGLVLTVFGCGEPKKPANEISVWHWMTDREEALATLARKYEQTTGIKVKFALFAPSDAYSQKIIAAAQANVLPDVYGILDKKGIMAAFIKEGYVADLTADFQADAGAWENSLYAKAIDNNRFVEGNANSVKPGIYGVPIDVSNMQMVYNRALLKKAGIVKPPATFEDFLSAVQALKRVGIAPFVTGFGERWIVDCFASNYAFNIMGEEKVMATFRGDVPYTDQDWITVFTVFQRLADNGAFIEGIVTKGNKYAEQDFALERAAFSFDGSWGVNIYKTMNDKLDYGVAPLPAVTPDRPMKVWGGAGSSFVVNDKSANKAKAIAFLKWLTAKEQQAFLAEETHNLPANREAGTVVTKVLGDFAKAMENSTHPSIWALNEDPVVVEAFVKEIQAIMIGEKTPLQAAQEIQKVKAHQLEKTKH